MEYEEKLTERSVGYAQYVLQPMMRARSLIKVSPTYRFSTLEKDLDDNKFADAAIVGNADYLVTDNTKDFSLLSVDRFPFIRVITSDDFVALLKNSLDGFRPL